MTDFGPVALLRKGSKPQGRCLKGGLKYDRLEVTFAFKRRLRGFVLLILPAFPNVRSLVMEDQVEDLQD